MSTKKIKELEARISNERAQREGDLVLDIFVGQQRVTDQRDALRAAEAHVEKLQLRLNRIRGVINK